MKKAALKCTILLTLALGLTFYLTGCGATHTTTPPEATAPTVVDPGYYSVQDEIFAKALAPLRAFIQEEIVNQYATWTPAQRDALRPALNAMKQALNVADPMYKAYHNSLAPGGAATGVTVGMVSDAITKATATGTDLQTALMSQGLPTTPAAK